MIIAPSILKCMSAEDRKALGKNGMLPEEALARVDLKNERDLQRQIVALLRLKGIEPIVSRMDKRTSNNLGTPDILCAIKAKPWDTVIALGIECKFGTGKVSSEQEKMHLRMSSPPNSWRIVVVRSVDEMLEILRSIGLAQPEEEN